MVDPLLKDLLDIVKYSFTQAKVGSSAPSTARRYAKLAKIGFQGLEIVVRAQQAAFLDTVELSTEDSTLLVQYHTAKHLADFYQDLLSFLNARHGIFIGESFIAKIIEKIGLYVPDVQPSYVVNTGVWQFKLELAPGSAQNRGDMAVWQQELWGELQGVLAPHAQHNIAVWVDQIRRALLQPAEDIGVFCGRSPDKSLLVARLSAEHATQQGIIQKHSFLLEELMARIAHARFHKQNGLLPRALLAHEVLCRTPSTQAPPHLLQAPLLPESSLYPLVRDLLSCLLVNRAAFAQDWVQNKLFSRSVALLDPEGHFSPERVQLLAEEFANALLGYVSHITQYRHAVLSAESHVYQWMVETVAELSTYVLNNLNLAGPTDRITLQRVVHYLMIYGINEIPHAQRGSESVALFLDAVKVKREILYLVETHENVIKSRLDFMQVVSDHYYHQQLGKTSVPEGTIPRDYYKLLFRAAKQGDTETLLTYLLPRYLDADYQQMMQSKDKLWRLLSEQVQLRFRLGSYLKLAQFFTEQKGREQENKLMTMDQKALALAIGNLQAKVQGCMTVDLVFWLKQQYPWIPFERGYEQQDYKHVVISDHFPPVASLDPHNIYCVRESARVRCMIWQHATNKWSYFVFKSHELPSDASVEHIRQLCGCPPPYNVRGIVEAARQIACPPGYLYDFYRSELRPHALRHPANLEVIGDLIYELTKHATVCQQELAELVKAGEQTLTTLQKACVAVHTLSIHKRRQVIERVLTNSAESRQQAVDVLERGSTRQNGQHVDAPAEWLDVHFNPDTLHMLSLSDEESKLHPAFLRYTLYPEKLCFLQVLINVNQVVDKNGNTLLHVAALHRQTNAVGLLRHLGLCLEERNGFFQTVTQYAHFERGTAYHFEVEKALYGSALQCELERFLAEYKTDLATWDKRANSKLFGNVVRPLLEFLRFHCEVHRQDRTDKVKVLEQGYAEAKNWYNDEVLIEKMRGILTVGFEETRGLLGRSRLEAFISKAMQAIEQEILSIYKPRQQGLYKNWPFPSSGQVTPEAKLSSVQSPTPRAWQGGGPAENFVSTDPVLVSHKVDQKSPPKVAPEAEQADQGHKEAAGVESQSVAGVSQERVAQDQLKMERKFAELQRQIEENRQRQIEQDRQMMKQEFAEQYRQLEQKLQEMMLARKPEASDPLPVAGSPAPPAVQGLSFIA